MRTWERQRDYRGMVSRGDPQDIPEGTLRDAVNLDCSRRGMCRKRRGLAGTNRAAASGAPRAVHDFRGLLSTRFYIVWDESGAIRALTVPRPEW